MQRTSASRDRVSVSIEAHCYRARPERSEAEAFVEVNALQTEQRQVKLWHHQRNIAFKGGKPLREYPNPDQAAAASANILRYGSDEVQSCGASRIDRAVIAIARQSCGPSTK